MTKVTGMSRVAWGVALGLLIAMGPVQAGNTSNNTSNNSSTNTSSDRWSSHSSSNSSSNSSSTRGRDSRDHRLDQRYDERGGYRGAYRYEAYEYDRDNRRLRRSRDHEYAGHNKRGDRD